LRRQGFLLTIFLVLLSACVPIVQARTGREALTVPVIVADYYVFSYFQAFKDRSFGYAYPTAVVDTLGWGLIAARQYPGMVCVNMAGLAKTVYPLVILCGKPERDVKRRAWVSLGTHAATLLWLKAWGKPTLRVESSLRGPDGGEVRVAWRF
jgi:hypothetical protein